MNIDLARKIDFLLGVPTCFVLSCWERASRLFWKKEQCRPEKILFIELSEMGSAILAYPSMKKIKDLYPEAEVYFLIFEKNREPVDLLEIMPEENVITIDESSLFSFFKSTIKAIQRVREIGIDTTVDYELFSRVTVIFSYLSLAVNRIGFHNCTEEGLYRGSILNRPVWYNNLVHISKNFMATSYALEEANKREPYIKISSDSESFSIPERPQKEEEQKEIFDRIQQVSGENLREGDIELFIFNTDPGLLPLRAWPKASYLALAEKIIADYSNSRIVFVGLSSHKNEASDYVSQLGSRALDFTGQTPTLKSLLVLFSISKALVTNDSGPAHMGPLVGLPSVVLFGPESPLRYAPLGEKVRAISSNLVCSPCLSAANHRNSRCRLNQCMRQISVEQVYRELSGII